MAKSGGRRNKKKRSLKSKIFKTVKKGYKVAKPIAKVVYKETKPYHKQMAQAGITAAGMGLSAATGNPTPAVAAATINSAISKRNNSSTNVSQHPTGAKT